MYYGHTSWIALVIFGGVLAVRLLTSQRRRGYRRRPPGSGRPLVTDDRPSVVGGQAPENGNAGTSSYGTPPGWFADPFFRHQQRFWSGSTWTEHVTDDDVPGTDPPPGTPSPDAP
jgi:Protein of unknown function (DUF2510)